MNMKTLKQATELPGITRNKDGLNLHFSPIPNWYMPCGFDCPICENPIEWDFVGEKPMITNETTAKHLKPEVKGATLINHGHRWLKIKCDNCQTQLFAENFD